MSYPQSTPPGRFGIVNIADGPVDFAATMPLTGLRNPLTGALSLAPLAVLVDHIAGFANHARRPEGHWTVSSELSMEFSPDAHTILADDPAAPVLAASRAIGTAGTTSLSVCDLTHSGTEIGLATVRTFYIGAAGVSGPGGQPAESDEPLPTDLADLMAVEIAETGGGAVALRQLAHPAVNNYLGAVHGGVAAAGLELVASAALNADRCDQPLHTASLRINYLRRLIGGGRSHYTATALHAGRSSGVAEARGIGDDGQVALTARLTAYRR